MLLDLVIKFFKIGMFGFGGGYAMLPLFKSEFLSCGIIDEETFCNIITISEMTPGSFTINAATFIGNEKAGFIGALLSTIAVVIPSLIILLIILILINNLEENKAAVVTDNFKPAVLGFILSAIFLLFMSTSTDIIYCLLLLFSLILIAYKKIHPIAVIFLSGFLRVLVEIIL